MPRDPYVELLSAISRNELEHYIMGEKGYAFTDRLVEHATNIAEIFLGGFNPATEAEGDKFNNRLNEALINLLNTPEGTWWVTTLIHYWQSGFKEGALHFNIYLTDVIPLLSKALKIHKTGLLNNKKFVGYRFERGLWEITEKFVVQINETISDPRLKIDLE